jgi:DnaK suppressor protein
MDAISQQHMAKAGLSNLRTELIRIDAALRRIDDDEFGMCLACDQPIPAARLEADPATPLCLNCKAASEQSR